MKTPGPPPSGPWYDLADLGCAGLGIGLAVASVRLFANGSAVVALCGVAIGAWGLASGLRRTRLPGWLADTLHLATGLWALLMLAAPAQRWTMLPTAGSVQTVIDAIRADFGRFDKDVAPLVAGTGHLVVMATLVWILGLFNSTGAMRLRAPVQGVVPHVVAFVGLGFVARGEGRLIASAAMLASVGTYALTQVAWRNAALRWVPRRSGVPALSLRAGAFILVLATALTAVVAPMLPGDSDPVVDLRRGGLGGDGPRTVVSPFVEVGSNLGPRSNELLFTVEAPGPQYWRLTALETYAEDRAIWVLSNSYSAVDGPLEPDARSRTTAELDVRALGGIWVPAPDDPVTAVADFGLNWDSGAQSLIRRSGELIEGDAVTFGLGADARDGDRGEPDPGSLRVTPPADGRGELVDDSGAPTGLRQLALDLSRDRTPYDALLALQDHFHEDFEYDETIDLSNEADPLEAFLAMKRGFCQQFSTAFALAARSLGYPTRVVVGFTAGDTVGEDADGRSVFAVRGRHAHAWPEVRFEHLGWVPFEPTPGRGNPATTAITGLPGAQAAPPAGEAVPEDVPTTSAAPTTEATDAPEPPASAAGVEGVGPEDPPGEDAGSAVLPAWPLALGALAVLAVIGLLVLRHRRASDVDHDRDPVAREWRLAVRAMADRGLEMSPTDTPYEFARRCDTALGMPGILDLAWFEAARRWSGRPPGEPEVASARRASRSITERLAELREAGTLVD